jgi:hypothetical protein
MTNPSKPLTKQELEEVKEEIKIERNRKEHYKKQLQMLKDKVKSGDIKDPENFKIESIPFDIRDLMNIESTLK